MAPPAHPSPVRLDPCEARPGGPRASGTKKKWLTGSAPPWGPRLLPLPPLSAAPGPPRPAAAFRGVLVSIMGPHRGEEQGHGPGPRPLWGMFLCNC